MLAECHLAILRQAGTTWPELEPGALMHCPGPFLKGTYRQPNGLCCWPGDSRRRWLLPRTALLPYHQFLQTQPKEGFWAAVTAASLHSGGPPEYLAQAQTEQLGPVPFRFESLGELLRYVHVRSILTAQFRWVEFKSFTPPSKFLQREHDPSREPHLPSAWT